MSHFTQSKQQTTKLQSFVYGFSFLLWTSDRLKELL